jgi:hypothetical protein
MITIIRRMTGVFVEVTFQAAKNPPGFETRFAHFTPGSLFRHSQEISFVKTRDQACPVAAENAMEVNGLKLRIS